MLSVVSRGLICNPRYGGCDYAVNHGFGRRVGVRFVSKSSALHSKPKKRSPDAHLIGKTVKVPAFIRARDLAKQVGIDPDRIEKFAREEGLKFKTASDIILDFPLCTRFLSQFNILTEYEEVDAVRSDYWDSARKSLKFPTRPSVIAVMGEIDHGKTSLLDALSSSHVAAFEPGKITQSLSAFTVDLEPNKTPEQASDLSSTSRVTFLDTPGHAAFENMRLSGASVSDFILLVISAVDGVKAQTAQIIKIAKKHWVPIVVAINKIDIASEDQIKSIYRELREMNVSKIRRSKNQAMKGNWTSLFDEVDDVYPVVSIVEISATKHTNMDVMKQVVKMLHRSMEDNLHVDPATNPAEATVIESYSSPGLGRVLLLITHLGTLRVGSHFVTNNCSGVIRSLRIADSRYLSPSSKLFRDGDAQESKRSTNSKEILQGSVGDTVAIESVGAGLPVLISGVRQDHFIPSGAAFFQLESKERADQIMDFRQTLLEFKMREKNGLLFRSDKHGLLLKKRSQSIEEDMEEEVEQMDDQEEEDMPDEYKNNLTAIFKADNQGRLDAILLSARETAQSMGYELKVLAQGVGDVTTHDLAIGQVEHEENGVPRIPMYLFNVALDSNAQHWMARHSAAAQAILPKTHDVFLDILKDLKQEIRMKIERQATLPPIKRAPTHITSSQDEHEKPQHSKRSMIKATKMRSSKSPSNRPKPRK